MADLPWHPGDLAVTPDGVHLVVLAIDPTGAPCRWINPHRMLTADAADGDHWPTDAVPSFDDVGTAARWLRSCAEVTRDNVPAHVVGIRQWNATRDAIQSAALALFWFPIDPALTARAVEATRAYLRSQA